MTHRTCAAAEYLRVGASRKIQKGGTDYEVSEQYSHGPSDRYSDAGLHCGVGQRPRESERGKGETRTRRAEGQSRADKGQSVTKVLLENEKYRVVQTRSKPGQKNEMKARSDRVIYSFNAGKSRIHYPDGKTEDVEFKAGEVRFRKADKSQSENIGKTETRNLVITAK